MDHVPIKTYKFSWSEFSESSDRGRHGFRCGAQGEGAPELLQVVLDEARRFEPQRENIEKSYEKW